MATLKNKHLQNVSSPMMGPPNSPRSEVYKLTVFEHQREYWRMKCWDEVHSQVRDKNNVAHEVLDKYNRLQRWDENQLMKVDWKEFYGEVMKNKRAIAQAKEDKLEADKMALSKFQINPKLLVLAFIVIFFIILVLM
eukprot:TRINITY_DN1095_c0_g1_i1.p1 TRINITY_DN1095_c0_g1~~TRINITY_DN1095_c0_g1_i1.p1  ORF type:complete len:137 (+),score=25.58 TRINITY_DN1095_c0_g1_i1:197-607(+)